MPQLIEGVVSDFAQPGNPEERPELTIGDMEEFAEKLKNMRLTYDHEHPAHSNEKRTIDKEVTVGRIVDAYIDDTECLRVRAELDDDSAGERTKKEIESNFLTGFSLGLKHRMNFLGDGGAVCNKELLELSITPVPEFANTSFVRLIKLPDGSEGAPVHKKLGDLKTLGDNYKGKVVAITASAGKRDSYTEQRSAEVLADLKRRSRVAPQPPPPTSAPTGNQPVARTKSTMTHNGQLQAPQSSDDPQLQAHIQGLRSRRDEQGERALNAGQGWQQSAPRNGVAPIHIHNYMDGTRRGARQQQMYQQQEQQRQQQQSRPRRGAPGQEQVVIPQFDDQEGDDGVYDDEDDFQDDYTPPQPPPPQQRQTQRRQPPQQQQQRRAPPARAARRQEIAYDEDQDDVPPPGPDVARRAKVAPRISEPKTKTQSEIKRIEKERRDAFIGAGGKQEDLPQESEDGAEGEDEFELFKKFQKHQSKTKGKRKQDEVREPVPRQQSRSAVDDNMYLDINDEDAQAADDGEDHVESADAKLRRENAKLRAQIAAAKNDSTKARVASIKSKLNKPSPLDDTDDVEDGGDDSPNYGGDGDDDKDFASLGVKVNEQMNLLGIDEHGKSQKGEELHDRVEKVAELRKKVTELKHKWIDANQDPKLKKKADKIAVERKNAEKELLDEWNKAVLDTRALESDANRIHGRTTDPRQLDLYSELIKRKMPSPTDLKMLNSQIVSITASSSQMCKTLSATLERFNHEKSERERLAFTAQEQARLLGHQSDSAAANRFVTGNDPVGRANKGKPPASSGVKGQAFFVPSAGRQAVMASGNYAGYDPVTRLPAGKSAAEFTLQDQLGVPFKPVDASKDVKQNTTMEKTFRQKKPNTMAVGVPRDARLSVRKGVWRTGNTDMMQAISASRADSDIMVTRTDTRHLTRELPTGATWSPNGEFCVLQDPFEARDPFGYNGGQ